jgi:hypothetical protein
MDFCRYLRRTLFVDKLISYRPTCDLMKHAPFKSSAHFNYDNSPFTAVYVKLSYLAHKMQLRVLVHNF